MKKIGVISLYGMDNYGNKLQNYAVNTVIDRIGGCPVNFLYKKKSYTINCILRYMLKKKYQKKRFKTIKRFMIFKTFDRKNVNEYASKLYKKIYKYDFFVCGSDQIWNPCWNLSMIYYFAAFAPKEKRIAYAASFGVEDIPAEQTAEYADYLNGMEAISVREESGAKIVKELTGRDVPVLIDPTMMLSKSEWQKVSIKPKYKLPDKYILMYFLGDISIEVNTYIENVSKQFGMEIICLAQKQTNKYWYETGPAEFIWLIEHCALMCTDSFHGSVFSVLMEAPFIVFSRIDSGKATMGTRIDTLLNTLKIPERRFSYQQGENIFEKNYGHIRGILETERKIAIEYLKDALELE